MYKRQEYTCNEANFPKSVAKLEMLPLGSPDEDYSFDGTEYESSEWRNDSWDGKVYTMCEEFRYDAPLLPEMCIRDRATTSAPSCTAPRTY